MYNPIEILFAMAILLVLLKATIWLLRQAWRLLVGISSPGKVGQLADAVLDTVLFYWTQIDVLTLKGLLDGGLLILGRPGSGKSSSSYFSLLKSIVAYLRSGGLLLAASTSDLPMFRRLFAEFQNRLVVFDEKSGYRFNVINFIYQNGGKTKDVLAAIMAIAESVDRSGGGQASDGDGSFFSIGSKRMIEHAITIVKLATGGVSPFDLMNFINSAANSLAEVHTDEFKKGEHYALLKAAYERDKSEADAFDFDNAREFFMKELPKMADRTRTSLIAVVMNTLHIFNSGGNRLLFATDTNISPKIMGKGKWILVNMPISRCGLEGAFALGVWKFATEWYVLRRDSSLDNPPCVIGVDEIHRTINDYDSLFLGECRKYRGCMIACTQSIASLYANMGGEAAEAQVDALLNNFSHKIIHALGDIKTASWASALVGSELQLNFSGAEEKPDSLFDAFTGKGVWSGSFNEQVRPVMEAREFMHGFRTGGKHNNYLCDAVVIRSGEPFASNAQNFIRTAFSQK